MILKQCSSREGFDSSNDIDQYDLEQYKQKSKTFQYDEECNQTFEKKPMIQESIKQSSHYTTLNKFICYSQLCIRLFKYYKQYAQLLSINILNNDSNQLYPFYKNDYNAKKQLINLKNLAVIQNNEERQEFEIQTPIINRPFVGMIKSGLKFDSNFESGNLDRVDYISNDEYNLYMRIDTNSIGHSNWFYFKITQNEQRKIKFNICNFTKPQSLYTKGMKPYVLSKKSKNKYRLNFLFYLNICEEKIKFYFHVVKNLGIFSIYL